MANITIKITSLDTGTTPKPNLLRIKRWSESPMSADGFDTAQRGGVHQFSHVTPYILDAAGKYVGTFSSNENYSFLSDSEIHKVAALQIADEFQVENKMQWLTWGGIDSWGAPMRVPGGGDWDKAAQVKQIGAYYADNIVEVLEERTFIVEFNGKKDSVPMSRIRTFKKSDWGVTFKTHPHLIHEVTVADTLNRHGNRPKGIVYIPVALGSDFDFAGNFVPNSHWLFNRWLEPL